MRKWGIMTQLEFSDEAFLPLGKHDKHGSVQICLSGFQANDNVSKSSHKSYLYPYGLPEEFNLWFIGFGDDNLIDHCPVF